MVAVEDFPITNFNTAVFTNQTAASDCMASTSGGASTAEMVVGVDILVTGIYTVTLTPQDSSFDSVLYMGTTCPTSTVGCLGKDDTVGSPEELSAAVNAGETLYIYVDGWSSGDEGPFHLDVSVEVIEDDCSDGVDNDGDNLIDCADPNCNDAADCFETECDDDASNDNDDLVDCDDPDCWASEFCSPPNNTCEEALELTMSSFPFTGDTSNYGNNTSRGDCEVGASGGTAAPEAVYKFTATEPGAYTFTVDPLDSSSGFNSWDAVLYISSGCPLNHETNCVGTADDPEEVTTILYPGQSVWIFVDGYFSTSSGIFTLDVSVTGIEASCDDGLDNDEDGETDCNDIDCAGNDACIEIICDDGLDEDNDGLFDCDDSDCTDNIACFEYICNDAADNDNDGLEDCADPDCADFSDCLAPGDTCQNAVVYDLDTATLPISGDSSQFTNQSKRSDCGSTSTAGSNTAEEVIAWQAKAYGIYTFTVTPLASDFDPVLYISSGCPLSTETCLGTKDNGGGGSAETLEVTLEPFQTVWIYTDGWSTGDEGPFELDVLYEGLEGDCADGLDNDGDDLFDCEDPDCGGNDFCIEFVCDDDLDEDGDGLFDCEDPDCVTNDACIEFICDDGLDEDGDGLFDCDDDDCTFSISCSQAGESCQAPLFLDPSAGFPIVASGSTSNFLDTSESCTSTFSIQDAPDVVYVFYPLVGGLYRFSLTEQGTDFDSYLYISEPACPISTESCVECAPGSTWSNCNNDGSGNGGEVLDILMAMGDGVLVFVDGYQGSSGNFELTVENLSGTEPTPDP